MAKDPFRAKTNRYQDKNKKASNERNDDQIAPRAASHSIDALQRWALATANIPQSGYRANEAEMVDRVRVRYEIQTPELSPNIDGDLHAELARSDQALYTSQSKKRDRYSSYNGFSDRVTTVSQEGFEENLHLAKWRRLQTLGVEDVGMSDRYSTSGEWDLASEKEVETSSKATKTRTFIDLTED
jgi:hypothetical protein